MSRLKIKIPDKFIFSMDIPIRISDINFAGHLGHDRLISLLHEVRARFFKFHGFTELDVVGTGIIMADLQVVYKSEANFMDVLKCNLAISDWSKKGCVFYYQLIHPTGIEVARASTSIVFFDYQSRRPVQIPDSFRNIFV